MELQAKFKLEDLFDSPNLATKLDKEDLDKIAHECYDGFEADSISREGWEKKTEQALKLALQVVETKSFPWQGASNIKFPLITIAALQYHARAYPVLLQGEMPVVCRVRGNDPDGRRQERADRVSNHMSYQILEEDESWEEETDRVLITQPIVGCAFKKTYYDPIKRHNISENILARDLVVNYWTKSLDEASRVTQILYMSKNDVYERVTRGLWLEIEDGGPRSMEIEGSLDVFKDRAQGLTKPEVTDRTTPYEILEHHCLLDLDQDGYGEPYIVYLRRDTKQVLRIVPRFFPTSVERDADGKVLRIKSEVYFTKFPFIPSPDGGFYDLGFGVLLGPLNEAIDTIINQLVDCGTMANTAGGFLSRGIKLRGGNYNFAPLEWKHVDTTGDDLRKGIVPLPVREPSQVLFTLLSLLVNYGERVGGSVDILVGENPGQNTPAETSRTMAEQGMKVFNGIFKRTYRALRSEFRKLYRLNQLYLKEAVEFKGGGPNFAHPDDYLGESSDIAPSADPNIISDSQRMMQAKSMLELAMTTPGVNIHEVQVRYARALKVEDIDKILPDPKGPNAIPPKVDAKVQIAQLKAETEKAQMQLDMKLAQVEIMQEAQLNQAKIHKLEAEAYLAIKEAGGIETGHAIQKMQTMISLARAKQDGLMSAVSHMIKASEVDMKKQQMQSQKESAAQ